MEPADTSLAGTAYREAFAERDTTPVTGTESEDVAWFDTPDRRGDPAAVLAPGTMGR